jgi:cellulose synthase/poly-beta-1,6-N-acetylglucosamine synthase-like glycosyltransferase
MAWILALITLDVIALATAYSFVISLKLYNRIYRQRARRRYRRDYAPTVSLFVPCAGANEHFADNIRAFLQLLHERAKLFFIVESRNDPAFPILRQLTRTSTHAYIVMAGPAKFCGQKNYNLLKGIRASEERDEVYVFLDSNTALNPQQLHDLLMPLSDPDVTASVGFRWNILTQRTLGERLHAFMIALQWSMMNCAFIQTIWGGAMALRRETFEKMGVREYWAQTSVDDMTLQQLIQQQRRKAIFVPTCVKETTNTIKTVKGATEWFTRQVLYTKFHLRPAWLATVAIFLYPVLNMISFPFLFSYSLIAPSETTITLTFTVGTFIGLVMLYCVFIKRRADDHNSTLSWFALSPVYMLLTCSAVMRTLFMRTLTWKGIAYELDYRGYVKKIVREPHHET